MRQSDVFPYYRRCSTELEKVYNLLKRDFDMEKSLNDLIRFRGYIKDSEQYNLLKELQIGSTEVYDVGYLGDNAKELGLLNSEGDYFLLNNRFIIPVRDISGNLITLIGYFPDKKKYITLPTPFFSKDAMFFNIDNAYRLSWEEYDGVVYLVEGIFDCLSLRAIGLPAIATMGSTVSRAKKEELKLFKKVVYIPDADKVGRMALNRYDKRKGWRVPDNATGIRLRGIAEFGEDSLSVKDIDNLVTWYDAEDVRELLLDCAKSNEIVEELQV